MEKVIFPGGSSRDSTKLGPKCVIISNDEWNLMIDCGAEFLPLKFLKDSDKYDKFLENSQNQFIAPINFEVFKGIKIDAFNIFLPEGNPLHLSLYENFRVLRIQNR